MTNFLARLLAILIVLSSFTQRLSAAEPLIFISSFAPGEKGAISACVVDAKTGALKVQHRTGDVEHPFFLAVSKDQKYLYSIHAKEFGSKEPEQVAAYALEGRTGRMKLLNRQSTRGTASCSLAVDATGKTLLVANYSTGSIASLPIKSDGSLGEAASFIQHKGKSVDPMRQDAPYAHCIVVSPDNKFALVADLGIDQVLTYRLDAAAAKLTPNDPPFAKSPPGAGPRHLAFDPSGKHVYVINELKNSVTLFDYDAKTGKLTSRQTISTLPEDFTGTSYCADLKITPNGKFLYGTNRGHDSLAAYRIGDDGTLTLIAIEPSLGKGPQNLAILPGGELLLCANMPGDNIAVFRIDQESGKLKPLGEPTSLLSPSCIMVLP
jgi:6-phosphogluconolactonase